MLLQRKNDSRDASSRSLTGKRACLRSARARRGRGTAGSRAGARARTECPYRSCLRRGPSRRTAGGRRRRRRYGGRRYARRASVRRISLGARRFVGRAARLADKDSVAARRVAGPRRGVGPANRRHRDRGQRSAAAHAAARDALVERLGALDERDAEEVRAGRERRAERRLARCCAAGRCPAAVRRRSRRRRACRRR